MRVDAEFTAEAVDKLVGVLRTQFHYIVADVPRIPGSAYWQAIDTADLRIIVADQTLRSVRDTVRLREGLSAGRAEHSNMLVVNRSGEGGRRAMTLQEMAEGQTAAKLCNPVPAEPVHRTRAVATRRFDGSGYSACRGNFGPCNRTQAVVEVRHMMTTGFGRRAPASQRAGLVLIPDGVTEFAAAVVDLASLSDLKERIRTVLLSRIDPTVAGRIPRAALRREIAKLVNEIATEDRVQLNKLEEMALAADLSDDMVGLGPLEPFLDDEEITDILVNGPFDIYVERNGKLEKTAARFRDAQHLASIAQRIATAIGRRIDEASPMVDARLADGSRVNIVLPPLVLNGGSISIRKFPKQSLTLDMMVRQQNLSPEVARLLEIAARSRLNMLISGGTGSGKTTLLNAVSQHIDCDERVITVEDAVELRLQQPHVVQMETRPPNIEGVGQVAQRELLRNALRMRPDRIIVGEVRGAEAFDMLQAMNTGHDGSMSTVHANSPRDALYRVENMVMMANLSLPLRAIRMQIASAVNLIVHIERMRDGIRRVQSIAEIAGMEGEIITTRELFGFQYRGERLGGRHPGRLRVESDAPRFHRARGTLRPRKRPPRRAWYRGGLNCSIQFCLPPFSRRRCSAVRFLGAAQGASQSRISSPF